MFPHPRKLQDDSAGFARNLAQLRAQCLTTQNIRLGTGAERCVDQILTRPRQRGLVPWHLLVVHQASDVVRRYLKLPDADIGIPVPTTIATSAWSTSRVTALSNPTLQLPPVPTLYHHRPTSAQQPRPNRSTVASSRSRYTKIALVYVHQSHPALHTIGTSRGKLSFAQVVADQLNRPILQTRVRGDSI